MLWNADNMTSIAYKEWGFSVVRGGHAQILLHITAEISGRRETEHIGNLDESQRLVAQLAGDIEDSVTEC